MKKKKNQKEKIKAARERLLRQAPWLKGRNSLRSNSLPFLTPRHLPALNAVHMRPMALRHFVRIMLYSFSSPLSLTGLFFLRKADNCNVALRSAGCLSAASSCALAKCREGVGEKISLDFFFLVLLLFHQGKRIDHCTTQINEKEKAPLPSSNNNNNKTKKQGRKPFNFFGALRKKCSAAPDTA